MATENFEGICSFPERCPRCNSAYSCTASLKKFNWCRTYHMFLSVKADILTVDCLIANHKRVMVACLLFASLQDIPNSLANGVSLYHVNIWRIVTESGLLCRTSLCTYLDGKQKFMGISEILKRLPKNSFILKQIWPYIMKFNGEYSWLLI